MTLQYSFCGDERRTFTFLFKATGTSCQTNRLLFIEALLPTNTLHPFADIHSAPLPHRITVD
ncbi:hypothetical protein [Bacteroides acidifaciens]|uniref:hypothetical protein n=1 Tax=Bacteroides acidifaciens TaxID=85831 RepID=UPI0031192144